MGQRRSVGRHLDKVDCFIASQAMNLFIQRMYSSCCSVCAMYTGVDIMSQLSVPESPSGHALLVDPAVVPFIHPLTTKQSHSTA